MIPKICYFIFQCLGKYMNTINQLQNEPLTQQFSSSAAQSTSSNNYTPTVTMSQQFPINHSLNGSQMSSNSFSSSLTSQLPSGASTSAQAATMSIIEATAGTSSVAQTVPLNMEKSQNIVQAIMKKKLFNFVVTIVWTFKVIMLNLIYKNTIKSVNL